MEMEPIIQVLSHTADGGQPQGLCACINCGNENVRVCDIGSGKGNELMGVYDDYLDQPSPAPIFSLCIQSQ